MGRPNSNGAIVWLGESWLVPGVSIVAIITGLRSATNNTKTGDMLQLWILLVDVSPVEAIKTGADRAICGDCIHRTKQIHVLEGFKFAIKTIRTCYVLVFQSPRTVWGSFKAGNYKPITEGQKAFCRSQYVRLGAYGDPSLIPYEILTQIINPDFESHTGYTAQWNNPDIDPRFRGLLMASVNSPEDRDQANNQGWTAFRIKQASDKLGAGIEKQCPADSSLPNPLACDQCLACNGQGKNQVVTVHGSQSKYFGDKIDQFPGDIFDVQTIGE